MKHLLWVLPFILLLNACDSDDVDTACVVSDLTLTAGDCTSDSTYSLTINFETENPGNDRFDVFIRNNVLIGNYPLSALPLTISDFKKSGLEYDFIRVCINDQPDCCMAEEVLSPGCSDGACEVTNLVAETGTCTSDSTYALTIDFDHANPGNTSFDVFVRNNVFVGNYPLSALPLTIDHFKRSGLSNDAVKVCINENPDCCKIIEFDPPVCPVEACAITDLVVDKGACTSDSTYAITINFKVSNTTNAGFDVFVRNNVLIGYYPLSSLPLTIPDFKVSGKDFDYIKVCINDNADCCKALEFPTENCK